MVDAKINLKLLYSYLKCSKITAQYHKHVKLMGEKDLFEFY